MGPRGVLFWALGVVAACGASAPVFTAPVRLGGVEVAPEVLERGRRTYALRCATCHGPDGAGDGPAGRALAQPPADLRAGVYPRVLARRGGGDRLPSDDEFVAFLRAGSPDRGMPPFAHLGQPDLRAVAQFLKTLSPVWRAPGPKTPLQGPAQP